MITVQPPKPLSRKQATVIREVFRSAGYTADALSSRSGLLVPPPREIVPHATLAAFSGASDSFSLLGQLFFLGTSSDGATVRRAVSNEFVEIGLECGLLAEQSENLVPQALVIPVQGHLFASDLQLLESQDAAHYVPTLCDAASALESGAHSQTCGPSPRSLLRVRAPRGALEFQCQASHYHGCEPARGGVCAFQRVAQRTGEYLGSDRGFAERGWERAVRSDPVQPAVHSFT